MKNVSANSDVHHEQRIKEDLIEFVPTCSDLIIALILSQDFSDLVDV